MENGVKELRFCLLSIIDLPYCSWRMTCSKTCRLPSIRIYYRDTSDRHLWSTRLLRRSNCTSTAELGILWKSEFNGNQLKNSQRHKSSIYLSRMILVDLRWSIFLHTAASSIVKLWVNTIALGLVLAAEKTNCLVTIGVSFTFLLKQFPMILKWVSWTSLLQIIIQKMEWFEVRRLDSYSIVGQSCCNIWMRCICTCLLGSPENLCPDNRCLSSMFRWKLFSRLTQTEFCQKSPYVWLELASCLFLTTFSDSREEEFLFIFALTLALLASQARAVIAYRGIIASCVETKFELLSVEILNVIIRTEIKLYLSLTFLCSPHFWAFKKALGKHSHVLVELLHRTFAWGMHVR